MGRPVLTMEPDRDSRKRTGFRCRSWCQPTEPTLVLTRHRGRPGPKDPPNPAGRVRAGCRFSRACRWSCRYRLVPVKQPQALFLCGSLAQTPMDDGRRSAKSFLSTSSTNRHCQESGAKNPHGLSVCPALRARGRLKEPIRGSLHGVQPPGPAVLAIPVGAERTSREDLERGLRGEAGTRLSYELSLRCRPRAADRVFVDGSEGLGEIHKLRRWPRARSSTVPERGLLRATFSHSTESSPPH